MTGALSFVAWSTTFASAFRWCCLADQGSPSVAQHVVSDESSSLLQHSNKHDVFVYRDDFGARWPCGRASDSRARGRGFDTYLRRVVSLSKDTFNPPAKY